MTDLLRLAHYPFLPGVREAVREAGPPVDELLSGPLHASARRRGLERVSGALKEGRFTPAAVVDDRSALQELCSVPVARMLCTLAGEPWLAARYAAAEARHLRATLDRDDDLTSLDAVLETLQVPAEPLGDAWRMHFADYLRSVPARGSRWKLVVRPVRGGWVPLDRDDLVELAAEALRRRIEAELDQERSRPLPADLRQALMPLLERIQPELEEARQRMADGDFGPVRRELFPPCMTDIFHQMAQGTLVPHHGRFAFASFLTTIGLDSQQIMDFFREVPNFDPEKSRYQIEHIAGERSVEKYTPPGCGWMQTNGVCPLAKRDSLCHRIKHPLSYYRARIRSEERAKTEADAILARAAAQQGQEAGTRPGPGAAAPQVDAAAPPEARRGAP